MKKLPRECGRELKADELEPRTVVVIGPEDRDMMTVWVLNVYPRYVEFRAGDAGVDIRFFRQPDGTLRDDSGKQIHVYEWNKKASRQIQ